nr:division/cell wall cluster transcriptional repressor MraZ [Candidatus Enterousia merdequi]
MGLFLSCYENRLDTKGRISVPAAFRSSLSNENFSGVVLFRSFTHNCIEGLSMSRMEKIAGATDEMGIFDNELDDLSAMVFADARPLQFDVTGRIVIPEDLLKHANIK